MKGEEGEEGKKVRKACTGVFFVREGTMYSGLYAADSHEGVTVIRGSQ